MTKVSVLGLGLMGQGIAKNILNAGYALTVWNRSTDKTLHLKQLGAVVAQSPAEAARDADVIITIVGDDTASRDVWLGEQGILSAPLKPDAIGIESTTVSRAWMQTLGQRCLDAGIGFLDSPVTGGPPGAEAGELTLLVGGEKKTIQTVKPILDTYAKKIIHFGSLGAGSTYKLIVNTVGAVHITALAEAMEVAERAGLNLNTVAEALTSGSVASRTTSYNAPKMAANAHDEVAFALKWRAKDAAYGVNMARELGCKTPILQRAADVFKRSLDQGLDEYNESAIQHVIKQES